MPDAAEAARAPLLAVEGCTWLEDTFEQHAEPEFADDAGRCRACGLGSVRLRSPLRVSLGKMPRRAHLIRVPPSLVVASDRLAAMARERKWTALQIQRVLERGTRVPTERFWLFEITSILPPMHATAPIRRSVIPKHCGACRRLGYEYAGEEPVYSKEVLDGLQDWNLSREWLAPHFVSCPFLLCSRRVADAVGALEKKLRWTPAKLV